MENFEATRRASRVALFRATPSRALARSPFDLGLRGEEPAF